MEPQMVRGLLGRKVAFIAAGDYYSFAATDTGDVFAWGCAQRQRLPGLPLIQPGVFLSLCVWCTPLYATKLFLPKIISYRW